MNKNNNKDQGFTLVELLIVIVILGILATVTVFAVRGITDKGQISACSADEKTLQVAVESYFAQYGGTAIPNTADGGTAPTGVTWTEGATAPDTLVASGLLVDVSTNYTVAANGTLTAVAPCAAPATTVL
jgi:prepilin-type N-terminal cleavage/methylation domain-containing protein